MNSRIRVMELVGAPAIGGVIRMILTLSRQLDRSRFEIFVCGLTRSDVDFTDVIDDLGVPTHIFGAGRFYSPRTVGALSTFIRQHDIDLIHTHAVEADVPGTIVGRLTSRPVLTTLHSVPTSFERRGRIHRTLQPLTIRHLSRNLVCVSDTAKNLFAQRWGIPDRRMRTIYPAVDLEPFLTVPDGVPTGDHDRPFQITSVGRLVPAKAQHLLIDAAPAVLRRFPNTNFTIVGPGPRQAELKSRARELGVAEHVTLTGPRRDIPDILARTDVFVLSSLWEGLPLSAVEAMAAARPVVLSNVGGCSELVEHGVNGLIVPPGESEAIASAINSLLGDEQRRLAFGRAGRERVRDTFTVSRMAKEYEAVYESLYAGSRRAQRAARPGTI